MEHSAFPSDETLAAFIDGRLDEEMRKKVVAHVADCEECYGTVMASRSFQETEETPATVSHRRSWKALWISSGSVAAAAVIALVIFGAPPMRERWMAYSYDRAIGIRPIVAVANDIAFRPTDGRLAGGFPYRPHTTFRGVAEDVNTLRLKGAVGEVLSQTEHRGFTAWHGRGVARLFNGEVDEAVSALQTATVLETGANNIDRAMSLTTDAELLNDLSVAYFARAVARHTASDFGRAYDAAERAWEIRKTPEIAWNRALALEALHMNKQALEGWNEFERIEPDVSWLQEARRHQATCRGAASVSSESSPRRRLSSAEAILWEIQAADANDSMVKEVRAAASELCSGYGECLISETLDSVVFGPKDRSLHFLAACDLVRHSRHSATPDAPRLVMSAIKELRAGGYRLADRLTVLLASSYYLSGRSEEALKLLEGIAPRVFADSQLSLAHANWVRGNVEQSLGYSSEALESYRAALNVYAGFSDKEDMSAIESLIAEAWRYCGDFDEAFAHDLRSVELGRYSGDGARYLLTLNSAARTMLKGGSPRAALLFLDEAVTRSTHIGGASQAYALVTRGLAENDMNLLDRARSDLVSAASVWNRVNGPDHDRLARDVLLLRCTLATTDDEAVAMASEALTFLLRFNDGYRLGRAYLMRGEANVRLGRSTNAEEDFYKGIAALESQRMHLSSESMRMSFFGTAFTLRNVLTASLVQHGRVEDAFDVSERVRARGLLDEFAAGNASPLSGAQIRASLSPDVTVVEYVSSPDRTLAFRLDREGTRVVDLSLTSSDLGAIARRLQDDTAGTFDVAGEAYQRLLAPLQLPVGRRLALLLEGSLTEIAFSALRDPKSGRYVIEDHELSVAPSASAFVEATAVASRRPFRNTVIVTEPIYSDALRLPPLQESKVELSAVNAVVGRADVLRGAFATPSRVLRDLGHYSLVHFNTHAVVKNGNAALVLTGDADSPSGLLAADMLRTKEFEDTRVVTLASCESGRGARTALEGDMGLPRAFLASGIPSVVASVRRVDDQSTAALMAQFYIELRRGKGVAGALRAAQLYALSTGSGHDWSAFAVYGAM